MFHKIEVGSVLADELTILATMYSSSLIYRYDLSKIHRRWMWSIEGR
jgi:hypothetical protein